MQKKVRCNAAGSNRSSRPAMVKEVGMRGPPPPPPWKGGCCSGGGAEKLLPAPAKPLASVCMAPVVRNQQVRGSRGSNDKGRRGEIEGRNRDGG